MLSGSVVCVGSGSVLRRNFQVLSVVQSYEYVCTASRSNVLRIVQNVCALYQSRPGTADCAYVLALVITAA